MKKALALLLALVLSASLAACGDTDDGSSRWDRDNKDNQQGTIQETEAPKPSRPYPSNILMEFSEGDQDAPAFGSSTLTRSQVTGVTFLDTLTDMPADAWDVSQAQDGSVMAWAENTELYIAGEGGVTASSCLKLFHRFRRLTQIQFNDCFYTDITTNMRAMFDDCWDLEELDLSFFITSQVTDMRTMFQCCYKLTELDLSGFDTSNVKDMDHMFFLCEELVTLNISSFDTSSVRSFGGMFSCEKLETLDLSCFDTSSAIDMSGMFYGCYSLKELDLSNFDTSNVVDMCQMFMECQSLTALDLTSFNTSNVTDMGSMFSKSRKLETVNVTSFNTSSCTDFGYMFGECNALKSVDLSGFDFSRAESTNSMFKSCGQLADIGCQITVPNGCDVEDMYVGCGLN